MAAPVTSTTTPGDWTEAHGSGTPLTPNKPSNVVDGDVMIMLCTSDQGAASATADFSCTGFTALFSSIRGGDGVGNGATLKVLYKVASSEGSSYSVARTGGSGNWGVTITRVWMAAGGTPVLDTTNYFNTALSTTNEATLAAATTISSDTLLLGLASWNEGKTYTSAPASYTLVSHTANSSNDMAVVQDTVASPTTVGSQSFDLSAATQCATSVIMLTPPGGTTTSTANFFAFFQP